MKRVPIQRISMRAFQAIALTMVVLVNPVARALPPAITAVALDKSRYMPGSQPQFSLTLDQVPSGQLEARVKYWRQGVVVATDSIPVNSNSASWSWATPNADYEGYLAEIELVSEGSVISRQTIGVDVSSDWSQFPRYGFLSNYPLMTQQSVSNVLDTLNRYHINGLQFYDWHHEHHDPLRGSAGAPSSSWLDIANRRQYLSTVSNYIDGAHDRNMIAMSYNLAYGALDSGPADGVQSDWYLFTDTTATNVDVHELPNAWRSDIYLLDPSNPDWREYIANKTDEAFTALPFDGWHIDQLGERPNPVYDASGALVNLVSEMGSFLADMKSRFPNKRFVFNAVNQYGQSSIASASPDILFTEVWQPNENYNDLANIIRTNDGLGGGGLKTVLAAYMNYDQSSSPGTFNLPSVLLTDAMIFAHGGAHLEIGEHMLGNEYYPNDNLQMSQQLESQMVTYYDFLVGYQNLLRGEGSFSDNPLTSTTTALSQGIAQQGNVAIINKSVDAKEVFHLINFSDATHMNWRDTNGTQSEPNEITAIQLSFTSSQAINRLWMASPDSNGGIPIDIAFQQSPNGEVSFELPSLKYWSMVVAESVPGVQVFQGLDDSAEPVYQGGGWSNNMNGGVGFGPWKLASESTSGGFAGFFRQTNPNTGIDNAGLPTPENGGAWTSYANKGSGVDRATAFRSFDQPLASADDSFSVTVEHGFVTGRVGVALRNGDESTTPQDYNTDACFEVFFESGSENYMLLDGEGVPFDTGVPFTLFGINVEFELTGIDTYDLRISRFDTPNDVSPTIISILGRTLAGEGPIESFALYQYDTASSQDPGVQSDVYFNNLAYRVFEIATLAGDYNQDGIVDAADYTVWRDNLGSPHSLPNDDTPGVGPDDYERWRSQFGQQLLEGEVNTTVPEPATFFLCLIALTNLTIFRA